MTNMMINKLRSYETIGEYVAAARESVGLTQSELAHETGISRPTISAIENGRTNPLFNVVMVLAKYLHDKGAPAVQFYKLDI